MEWSSLERLEIYVWNVAFRMSCRAVLSRLVSRLYSRLSRGLRLLRHLLRALRFSVTKALIWYGVLLVGSFRRVAGGVDRQAASCIKHVKVCTASSTSAGCFNGMLRCVCSFRWVLKLVQSVLGDVSLGIAGLENVWVLSVRMIGVWSEVRSQAASMWV
jgi:hypothetical protein